MSGAAWAAVGFFSAIALSVGWFKLFIAPQCEQIAGMKVAGELVTTSAAIKATKTPAAPAHYSRRDRIRWREGYEKGREDAAGLAAKRVRDRGIIVV